MSTFELPRDVPEHHAFWRRQIERLGDRDPLEVLAATPARVEACARSAADAGGASQRAEDVWSLLDHLTHLVDVEFVFGWRTRKVLFEEEPLLRGMDHERWVREQRRHETTALERAAEFAAVRGVNLALWRRASAEDIERVGLHESTGKRLPLGFLLRLLAGHDLVHLDRIQPP